MTTQKSVKEPSYLEYKGTHKGIFAWILSTDHKRIALLYLYTMLAFFSIGAIMGLLMKFELLAPGKTIMDAQTYNAFFTVHGVIMIFVIVIPGLPAVFGNFFLPIMIGAKDVAFPPNKLIIMVYLYPWYNFSHHFFGCRRRCSRHRLDFLCALQL
jgi:cytochrome c oxidase subunit 1